MAWGYQQYTAYQINLAETAREPIADVHKTEGQRINDNPRLFEEKAREFKAAELAKRDSEKRRKIMGLLISTRSHFAAKEYELAETALADVLRLDNQNAEAILLQDQIRKAIAREQERAEQQKPGVQTYGQSSADEQKKHQYKPIAPVVVSLATDDPWLQKEPSTKREFFLYVPQTYNHNKPAPVIIACHGKWPRDSSKKQIDAWKGYGEKYGCIVIAPKLSTPAWNSVKNRLADEQLILYILSGLSYKYNLDRANVMITGFSEGGEFVYWMGLRYPDIFSVLVADNCGFKSDRIDGQYPLAEAVKMPIFIYYGEKTSKAVIKQSKIAVRHLRSRGFKVNSQVVEDGFKQHPEMAMWFFRINWNKAIATMRVRSKSNSGLPKRTQPSVQLKGPRPPMQ